MVGPRGLLPVTSPGHAAIRAEPGAVLNPCVVARAARQPKCEVRAGILLRVTEESINAESEASRRVPARSACVRAAWVPESSIECPRALSNCILRRLTTIRTGPNHGPYARQCEDRDGGLGGAAESHGDGQCLAFGGRVGRTLEVDREGPGLGNGQGCEAGCSFCAASLSASAWSVLR